MLKKTLILFFLLILGVVPIAQANNCWLPKDKINVIVNGNILESDTSPIIENGRVLIPLRTIFEAMGAKVEWDATTQKIKGSKDSTTIRLEVGSTDTYINGEKSNLDVPPKIVNGRTLVPARFIAESFNAEVAWDSVSRTVFIKTN